jgi:hypothetical protein
LRAASTCNCASAARSIEFDADLCADCLAERARIVDADPGPEPDRPEPEPPVIKLDVFGPVP